MRILRTQKLSDASRLPWPGQALAAVLLLLALFLSFPLAHAQADFLAPEQAFRLSVASGKAENTAENITEYVDVHFAIAPTYYLYRARFAFETDVPGLLGQVQYPVGEQVDDPTFGEIMEIYRDAVTVRLPLQAKLPAGDAVRLNIVSQGCAQAGLCYPPMRQSVMLLATAQGYAVQGDHARVRVPAPLSAPVLASLPNTSSNTLGGISELNDEGLAAYLRGASHWRIVGLSFVLGLLLAFTPCVLPMVPILLTLIAGKSQHVQTPDRWRGLGLALTYVLGVSIVYTLLGVVAALLGASLNQWLQTPWVLGGFAALLALLGLSMLGAFTLQTPGRWQGWLTACMNRLPGGRFAAVLCMGMLSALIVGACVVAPLAGLLLFISQTGQVLLGAAALFALAWGAGVPLLLVGAGADTLLPRAGGWMQHVNTVFGVLLLATAWWMFAPFLAATWAVLGWALLAMWGAGLLGVSSRAWTTPIHPLTALARAAGWLLALWSALMLLGIALGSPSVLQPLRGLNGVVANPEMIGTASIAPKFQRIHSLAELEQRLARATRPVMLDFYADWCVSCVQMERLTFSDAAVAQRMAQFELLQVDVTAHNSDDRALLQRFNLYGPPGILFFDAQGQYLSAHRVIGFKNSRQFGAILDAVKNST